MGEVLGCRDCNKVICDLKMLYNVTYDPGFIRVREMSGKFKIFQGQGIVRESHNLSGKIEFLLKCQGNVREF